MSFPVPLLSRCAFCIYLEILTRIPIIDELIPKFSARHTLLTVIFASDSQPPDVTHTSTPGLVRGGHGGGGGASGKTAAADRVNRYASSTSDDNTISTGTGRWKVSAKIQQLLNTLKRPKRRPLPEFYEDDDIELEIAANPKDPNAPKPEGKSISLLVA